MLTDRCQILSIQHSTLIPLSRPSHKENQQEDTMDAMITSGHYVGLTVNLKFQHLQCGFWTAQSNICITGIRGQPIISMANNIARYSAFLQ